MGQNVGTNLKKKKKNYVPQASPIFILFWVAPPTPQYTEDFAISLDYFFVAPF